MSRDLQVEGFHAALCHSGVGALCAGGQERAGERRVNSSGWLCGLKHEKVPSCFSGQRPEG